MPKFFNGILVAFMFSLSIQSIAYAKCDFFSPNGNKCVFNGEWSAVWQRECRSNACSRRYINLGGVCESLRVCMPNSINPNSFSEQGVPCTDWVLSRNVCPGNKRRWVRACTQGGWPLSVCSDLRP